MALFINTFVGAGIFGLPARVFELTGIYSIAAFLGCGLLVMLIVACFAEVSSRFEKTGGAYLYAHRAFGPAFAFQIGWLLWITRLAAFATICNLLLIYLEFFFPGTSNDPVRSIVITAIVGTVALVNWRGIRQTALVSNLFTVGKLVPLLLLVSVGLATIDMTTISASAGTVAPLPTSDNFALAIVILVFAFSGFEVTTITAGEARSPTRDYPFALFTSLGFVIVLYVLIQIVCLAAVQNLGASQRPLVDAGVVLLGRTGGVLIAIGAIISMIGTLNATFLGCTRLPFALAENGQLPIRIASLDPRFQTPVFSIVISATLIWIASLGSSFLAALTISAITKLLTYIAVCAALLKLRSEDRAPFHIPLAWFIAGSAVLLCIGLLTKSGGIELLQIGIGIGIGYLVYRITNSRTIALGK